MATDATMSVAIASYNGARYIRAQLDSIAAQTRYPHEVIVADDCSTDDTCELVIRFAESAPFPVKLIRHERNIGILENFYSAFSACSGEIILYCDQDDVWRENKVAKIQEAFSAATALVTHQSEITDADLAGQGRVEPGNPIYGRLTAPVDVLSVYGFGHQMAFSREVLNVMLRLKSAVEVDTRYCMANNFDSYIPFCASLVGDIVVLPDPLVRFRRHSAATTGAGRILPRERGIRRLARRAAEAISLQAAASGSRLALIEDGWRYGALDRQIGRDVHHALGRQHARALAVSKSSSGSRTKRIAALPGSLVAAALPTGFSNDRRWRIAIFVLTIALLSGRPLE